VTVPMISSDDGIMPDDAMRHFAHVLGIFANAVLNRVPDLAECIAVMPMLGQAALSGMQFHGSLIFVSNRYIMTLRAPANVSARCLPASHAPASSRPRPHGRRPGTHPPEAAPDISALDPWECLRQPVR